MSENFDKLKLGLLNVLAWVGTGVSLQHVQAFVAIACGLGSLAVSLTTIWWIRKQAKAHDQAHKK